MLKSLITILVALSTISSKAFSGCEIEQYFAQPTPKGERSIIIKGSPCHPELIEFFKSSEQEDQRYNSLELIIAATNITPEVEDFLTDVLTSEKTSLHEKGLVDFFRLSKNPENSEQLKKVITYLLQDHPHNMGEFRFSLFHSRGLVVLEAIMSEAVVARHDMIESASLTIRRHFRHNTDEILLPNIEELYEQAKQAEKVEAIETALLATTLLELISYKEASAFQQRVLSEVDDYPLDLVNAVRSLLVSVPLKGAALMPKELSKQLPLFYLNKHTAPQGKDESDDAFMDRRSRLLTFSSYLKILLVRNPDADQEIEFMIRDHLIQIFSNDLEEFTISMMNVVSNLDTLAANRIISKLIQTNKVLPVTRAFQLIRRIPAGRWKEFNNTTESFKNLARFHSMQVSKEANGRTNPESLRLEAAAALLHMTDHNGGNLSTILTGLRDTDEDVRLTTLSLANEQYCSDPLIADALVMVIRHDPSLVVRTAALRLITAQIERSKNERLPHPLLESSKVGIAILYSWNETDSDLFEAAENALSLYAENSRHAQSLLLQGVKSSNNKMAAASRIELEKMITDKLTQSINLMAGHSQNTKPYKYSVEFMESLKKQLDTNFSQEDQEK